MRASMLAPRTRREAHSAPQRSASPDIFIVSKCALGFFFVSVLPASEGATERVYDVQFYVPGIASCSDILELCPSRFSIRIPTAANPPASACACKSPERAFRMV